MMIQYYPLFDIVQMLANLIISSNLMDKPKDVVSLKSTHFAPNLEVFSYTDTKANSSDDQFLLTPNEKRNEKQIDIEVEVQQEKLPEQINLEFNQYQTFENEAQKRREEFKRRMTRKEDPAKFQAQSKNEENPFKRVNEEKPSQGEVCMEIEMSSHQKSQVDRLQQEKEKSPSLKNSRRKQDQHGSLKKPVESLSIENQEKIASLTKMRSKNPLSNEQPLNQKEEQKRQKAKQERRRVTQDLKTLMHLGIFSQKQEDKDDTKETDHQKDKIEEVEINKESNISVNAENCVESKRRESLINRAFARLSGGKVSKTKKNRVTIDPKEISNFLQGQEDKPQSWISKIDSIKEEAQNSSKILQHDKYKENLKKHLEQTNLRVKNIDEKNNETHEQNLNIQNYFKQQEGLLTYLDQQINKKVLENQTIKDKTNKYKMKIDSPEQIKKISSPLYYLESNYNVKVLNYEFSKGGNDVTSNYILDFILATNIYCRIKRLENHTPTIFIRSNTLSEVRPPEWTIDIKLRIQLLAKYFKIRLQTLEPVEMLLHLAKYYEHLQLLQNDFRMIQKICDLKDLTLCPSNEKLSFSLEVQYGSIIHIIVSLLDFKQPNCYIMENVVHNEKRRESLDKKTMTMNCNGEISLIEFISDKLLRVIL